MFLNFVNFHSLGITLRILPSTLDVFVEESGTQVSCAHSLLLFHHKCHLIPPALHVMVLVVKGFFEEKP